MSRLHQTFITEFHAILLTTTTNKEAEGVRVAVIVTHLAVEEPSVLTTAFHTKSHAPLMPTVQLVQVVILIRLSATRALVALHPIRREVSYSDVWLLRHGLDGQIRK